MKLPRRQFLHLAAGVVAAPAVSRVAWAQAYPSRPVRVIVGQAAGSSSDITARLIGQWVSQRLGQQFIVEVRPGAAGNIATEAAANAAPDGYTILLINAQNTINHALYDKLSFNFLRDIVPVAGIDRVALVMEVHPSFPAKTVRGIHRLRQGQFRQDQHGVRRHWRSPARGRRAVQVHGRRRPRPRAVSRLDPALTDLIAGQVQVMFDVTPSSIPHIKSGTLRPLGVTTVARMDILPDVPPIADFVPGYEASAWVGFGAPRNTPAAIVDTLNKAFNEAIADPAIQARLADLGATAMPQNTPAEFARHIANDADKWARVIKASGIKPE